MEFFPEGADANLRQASFLVENSDGHDRVQHHKNMATKDSLSISTPSPRSQRTWFSFAWTYTFWAILLSSIVYYVWRGALHYLLHYTRESFGAFWPDRILIRTHIACAVTMIFTGPFQFWTGFRMRYLTLHTWLGRIFLLTGTFVASSAMYLGLHPRTGGIVMGIGLSLNGLFWLAAAAMAYYAIRLRNIPQHKEWMIRTYVLAWNGIVGDRILADIPVLTRRIGANAVSDLSGWLPLGAPPHGRRGCDSNESTSQDAPSALLMMTAPEIQVIQQLHFNQIANTAHPLAILLNRADEFIGNPRWGARFTVRSGTRNQLIVGTKQLGSCFRLLCLVLLAESGIRFRE